MTRDDLQRQSVIRMEKARRLVCQWATGTGKSNVAIKFLQKHPGYSCLILVPESNNIENWQYECKKFGLKNMPTVVCYASLHLFANTTWDLLVLDEVPHIDTALRKGYLRNVSARYVLALGAAIDEEEMASLTELYGEFDVSSISLSEAISLGILARPTVYILHLQMDDTIPIHIYKGRRLTDRGYYDLLNTIVNQKKEQYSSMSSEINRLAMLKAGNKRKRFLGEKKEDAMRRIAQMLDKTKTRYICFCSSIAQAKKIGGENAFTSLSKKSEQHLQRFNNYELDSLFVVGKCIEGQNLRGIECGIIGQLGGTERITIQEVGRILRSDNPRIFIPVFDNTKDDYFIRTLTDNVSANYIKHYKF